MEEEKPEQEIRPVNKFFGAPGNGNIPESNSSVSKALLILVGVVILLLIGTSIYLIRNKFTGSTEDEGLPPAVEISSPSPTPAPEFERSKYTLRVLNGTKVSGMAASVSAKLKELGYKIDKTGNATSSAFTRTEVRVKEKTQGLLEQLIKDLMPDFDATSGAALKVDDTVDGEVILGAK